MKMASATMTLGQLGTKIVNGTEWPRDVVLRKHGPRTFTISVVCNGAAEGKPKTYRSFEEAHSSGRTMLADCSGAVAGKTYSIDTTLGQQMVAVLREIAGGLAPAADPHRPERWVRMAKMLIRRLEQNERGEGCAIIIAAVWVLAVAGAI